MLQRFIDFHLHQRFLVLVALIALLVGGIWALTNIPIDAFPDLTNNQVVIVTEARGMAPVEVEQLVTFPIESAVMGLPRTLETRSISKLGLSIVTIVFEDSVEIYLARQLVTERLNEARSRIPSGLEPTLGPVATAFGEVFQYTVEGDGYSMLELKTIHDWLIRYQLRTVPGVGEVNSWGGFTQQYHIVVDPRLLRSYSLSLRDIYERVRDNNANFGGGYIEHASEQYNIRGIGRAETIQDLDRIVVASHNGVPVYLRDIAEIAIGAMPRQGAVTRDGRGETVSGMVIMLKGENGKVVNARVQTKLKELSGILPAGVRIKPFYDQSEVINRTITTVRNNLVEGGLLVVVILFLFLGNIRGALIVAAVIPLSMLFGFMGMMAFGVTANLMSLGAIDFGLIVDGSVVMMENAVRKLQKNPSNPSSSTFQEIRAAAHEVARPVVFGVAIIISVYLPVLTLEGLEGRMFRPMAITVCCALVGSLILALTVVPVATSMAFRNRIPPHRDRWFRYLRNWYSRMLPVLLDHRVAVISVAILVVAGSLSSLAFIGTEFMPRLDEGSILIETRKLPSVSLTESVKISNEIEKLILQFPEVESVVTKIGRPDLATEAMGIYQGDVYVMLKPREEWTTARTKEGLIEALSREIEKFPGVVYNFTQPMAMRLDETISGVKADLAIKVFGDDPEILDSIADQILHVVSDVEGAADVQKEVFAGAAEWQIIPWREELARYGVNISELAELIEAAVGGWHVTEMIDGRRRFDVVIRLPESYRANRETLSGIQLRAPQGELIDLRQVADIKQLSSPEVIQREDGQRRLAVQANVRGRDLGGFVAEVRERIQEQVQLPTGYYLQWGGQFENQERAMRRLSVVVPTAIFLIFVLLFWSFNSVSQALLILVNVPFAAVGGIAALWLRDMNLNLSASVGFIAVFGVAVLNGVVLVSYFNRLLQKGNSLRQAIIEGSSVRLRPVLMTALVASLGFLPMATATSAGAEVQRPLATVVIGGLVTSTLLTLVVLPVLFSLLGNRSRVES